MTATHTYRVLLVDDEPLARLVARKSLEAAGCFVVEGEGCAQGEQLWKNGEYDLVVLDHRMEDGTGLDLLRKQRAADARQPVVYLTADAEDIDPDTCGTLSISAVLSKPLDPEALKNAAMSILQMKGSGVRVEYRGRFQLAPLPSSIDREALQAIKDHLGNATWVALDARQTRNLDGEVLRMLIDWAQECRWRGGRLCLAGLNTELFSRLTAERIDHDLDVLPDLRALEALGRRLSSSSERLSILDSVVRTDS